MAMSYYEFIKKHEYFKDIQDGYILVEEIHDEKRILKLRVPEGGQIHFSWSYQVWKKERYIYVKKKDLPEWAEQILQLTIQKIENKQRLPRLLEGK